MGGDRNSRVVTGVGDEGRVGSADFERGEVNSLVGTKRTMGRATCVCIITV